MSNILAKMSKRHSDSALTDGKRRKYEKLVEKVNRLRGEISDSNSDFEEEEINRK